MSWILAALSLFLLAACHSMEGQGALIAGVAGGLAALNEMLAAGTVTPEQHSAIVGAITTLEKAASSGWSTEEVAAVSGGTTASIIGILKSFGWVVNKAAEKKVASEAVLT